MYRAPSKRSQVIKRSIIYTCMTLFVVLAVTALVFLMLGYRFNKTSNTIIQGGLVQFDSKPSGARVTIGSAKLASRTPSKITVNPGSYSVKMERAKYRNWQKTVDVEAGHVLYLKYAKLVPNQVASKTLTTLPSVDQMTVTPNDRFMAVLASSASPELTMVDLKDSKQKQTVISLPIMAPEDTKPVYKIEKWSGDSKKLLISQKTAEKTNWFFVEYDKPDQTVDLSKTYDLEIKDVLFDPRGSERLIITTTDGAVRLLDVGSRALSPVVLSNITDLSLFKSNLMYVKTLSQTEQSVGYLSLGRTESRELKSLVTKETVRVSADEYYHTTYLAITTGSSLEVSSIDSLPGSNDSGPLSFKTLFNQIIPGKDISKLAMRTGGRFVVAQSSDALSVYDLELKKFTTTKFATAQKQAVRWIDGYHFYSAADGKLTMMDFDGANQQVITKTSGDMDVAQSDNGKYWFTLNKTETGYQLIRLTMIL